MQMFWNKLGRNLTDLCVFCMQHMCTLSVSNPPMTGQGPHDRISTFPAMRSLY